MDSKRERDRGEGESERGGGEKRVLCQEKMEGRVHRVKNVSDVPK